MQTEKSVRFVRPLPQIWTDAQVLLSKRLLKPSFESWIKPARLLRISTEAAVIGVPNDFVRSMVANHYLKEVRRAISEVINQDIPVQLEICTSPVTEVEGEESYSPTFASIQSEEAQENADIALRPSVAPRYSQPENRDNLDSRPSHSESYRLPSSEMPLPRPINQASAPGAMAARIGNGGETARVPRGLPSTPPTSRNQGLSLNNKYTFSTFVVGSHNRFCHSAALAVAQKPGEAYNPLFIYGGVGLGKTHIMHAIGHAILNSNPNAVIRYISCERFTNELINSIQHNRTADFRKRYRQVDVLLVDDIQFIEGKESTQEEFFHTFNALRDNGKQIVISSDRPPKALARLEERLRSRFEWGLTSDIQAPDLETRLAILHKKCELEKMNVDALVLEQIASTFTSNIRELEGALTKIHAYASLTGETMTSSFAQSILQPFGSNKKQRVLTVEDIIEAVASQYKLEAGQLKSSKRTKNLTLPRHVAMYLAHELADLSFPVIGQAFGGKAHTSAIYACDRIKKLIESDSNVRDAISRIKRTLQS